MSFKDKKTALDYAYDRGNEELISMLKESDGND